MFLDLNGGDSGQKFRIFNNFLTFIPIIVKKLVKLCTEHAEMFRKRLQKVINRKGINKLDLTEIKLK